MSISIIDFTGEFFSIESLRLSEAVIILCNESCLVPSSIGATLIEDPKGFVIASGIFVIRLPSDFHRGIVFGLIYGMYQNTKIFTSRKDLYSKVIPQQSIEHAVLSVPKPSPPSPQKPSNKDFEDVYNESLLKIAKNILLQRPTRSIKYNSLVSQCENFVSGVLVSFVRKKPLAEIDSAKNIANIILDDLENQDVFKNFQGRVEYNESLIQDFFGNNKQKIFVPSYVKQIKVEVKPNASGLRPQAPFVPEEIGFGFREQNLRPQEVYRVQAPAYAPVDPAFRPQASANRLPEAGFRANESGFRQGPELGYRPQETDYAVQEQARFKMEQSKINNNSKFPVYGMPQHGNVQKVIPAPSVNLVNSQLLKNSPQVSQPTPTFVSVPEIKPSQVLNTFAPQLTTLEPSIKPKVMGKSGVIVRNKVNMTSNDWENCDHFVIDKLTEKVSESINDFKSVFNIYRASNTEVRNYIEENNFTSDENMIQLHLKKYIKFLIELFFVCDPEKSSDEIAENYNKYLSVNLLNR